MKVDLKNDDLVFKRIRNGWVVERAVDGEYLETTVYEDVDHADVYTSNPGAHSLARAIGEEFNFYSQTKHRGGLNTSYTDKGRDTVEELEEMALSRTVGSDRDDSI
jgi:hypothetical protein